MRLQRFQRLLETHRLDVFIRLGGHFLSLHHAANVSRDGKCQSLQIVAAFQQADEPAVGVARSAVHQFPVAQSKSSSVRLISARGSR